MTDRKRHRTKHPGVMYREASDGSRRYIVLFTDGHGKQRTETLPEGSTLQDAIARRGQLKVQRAHGETIIRTKLSVGELLDQWLEKRTDLSPGSAKLYRWAIDHHLKPAFGYRKVRELSPNDVAKLVRDLKSAGKKTWTVRSILNPLNGAYRYAVREGWVSSNPVTKLLPGERPKDDQRKMRCMEREEISKLLEAASSDQWRTLFATLVFTGLRISEALALTWDAVDMQQGLLEVRKSKTEKGVRSVMLMAALRASLSAHKLRQAPGTSFVFVRSTGLPVTQKEALRALRAAEKKAGLPDYTLHELRHTFASILISHGELPTFVAHQMGHADPGITMKTYAHLFEKQESVDRARERLQEAFGGMV